MKVVIEYSSAEKEFADSLASALPDDVLVVKKKKYNTRKEYYLDNVEKRKMYQKERYAKTHKRKYARYYEIITPEGEVIRKDNVQEVLDYFGYSYRTIERRLKNNDLFGFTIRKIV